MIVEDDCRVLLPATKNLLLEFLAKKLRAWVLDGFELFAGIGGGAPMGGHGGAGEAGGGDSGGGSATGSDAADGDAGCACRAAGRPQAPGLPLALVLDQAKPEPEKGRIY